MTDRVPGAPGQYKAIITADELQKLQSGEQFVITMTRDDQPITEGTPYSKAAVLPDDLAAIICPDVEDPTPADALRNLLPATESTEYPSCYYRMIDGVQEWINPPMAVGAEYRTTERWKGLPVYVKLVDVGILPSNTTKGVAAREIIGSEVIEAHMVRTRTNEDGTWYMCGEVETYITITTTSGTVYVTYNQDNSTEQWTGCVLLKYAK